MTFHAIIPAGGAGTRLWPLSRRNAPKFLADLTGAGRTLIQQTADRLEPLTGENIWVVTGVAHAKAVGEQLHVDPEHIVVEPSPRDSMAAIGLAAAIILETHGDVVVGSFAADHLIKDEEAFRAAVTEAIAAADLGYVVTIGITPDAPSTAYGYIHEGASLDLPTAHVVTDFLEKPDAETAAAYLDTGEYRWNAGMFVAKASVLLGALERFQPELHAGLMSIARGWNEPGRPALAGNWDGLKKIAIDHAIAEPLAAAGGVAVVPVEMGWSDVGDFASLADVLDPAELIDGVAPGGEAQQVLAMDSPGALVYSHSKPIVVLGLEDAVVVETADAFLVTTRDKAQDVKKIVDELSARGLDELR